MMENFNKLGISNEILSNLKSLNLLKPTPVQQRAIQPGLEGSDILAIANTGTGKTAAFGIPIIERLNKNKSLCAIILTPTRELAVQVSKHLNDLMGKNVRIKTAVLIGGDSIKKQIQLIKQTPRIFIGTPGRINDHIRRKTLNIENINILVLDETDRMLDLGFIEQIQKIINILPQNRQTLLFTATLPNNIKNISEKYLNNPVKITVETKENILKNIEHNIINIKQVDKYEKLLEELHSRQGSILVFMKTKHSSKKIYLKLQKDGVSVNAIHGNVRQNKRLNILNKFRNEKFTVLIATDIAARGLDIPHIEHVINYDLPQRSEDYIHRIGRTARAGKKGSALSFISENDTKIWKDIFKLITPDQKNTNSSNDLTGKSLKQMRKYSISRKKNNSFKTSKDNYFKSNNEDSANRKKKNNNSKNFKGKYLKPNNEDSTNRKKKNNNSQNFKGKYFKSDKEDSTNIKKKNNNSKNFKGKYFKPNNEDSTNRKKKNNNSKNFKGKYFKPDKEDSTNIKKKNKSSQNFKGKYFKPNNEDSTNRKKKNNNSQNFKGKYFKQNSEDSPNIKKKNNNSKNFKGKYLKPNSEVSTNRKKKNINSSNFKGKSSKSFNKIQ